MLFRLILFAPSSYTGTFDRCDKILQHKDNIEIYTPAQKGIIKAITGYATQRQHKLKVFKVDWQGWGAMAWDECFKAMVEYADAAIIFTDGESKLAYKLEVLCTAKPVPVRVIRYEKAVKERVRVKSEIHEAIDEAIAADKLTKKQKRKKYAVDLPEWCLKRYLAAHENWFKNKNTHAYNDGYYQQPEKPIIDSGSRMASFICNFLKWSGWSANQITVMGRKVDNKWIPSSTKNGTFDVTATIKSKSVKLEMKHRTDKPSNEQLEFQQRERAAGGIAEFVYSIEDFFLLYDSILLNSPSHVI